MNEHRLDTKELAPIDVYVTANVAIWRQLGMWQGYEKRYTFVPTRPKGIIIITAHDKAIECKSLKGFTLIRPAGLELAWDTDKLVVFHTLSMIEAIEWELRARKTSWNVYGGDFYP